MKSALAMLSLAACGGLGGADSPGVDSPISPDANDGCVLSITHTPETPVLGIDLSVRAVAHFSNAPLGAHTFEWVLLRNGSLVDPATEPANAPIPAVIDGSEVTFPVTADAIYTIAFELTGEPACLQARKVVDVTTPGVNTVGMRVHVVAPAIDRPPLVKNVTVEGGANDLIDPIILDQAITLDGTLELAGAPVAGYLRFMPAVGGEAAVETYANPLGEFQVNVRPETHDVLVVPTTPNVPPQKVTWQQQTTLALAAGQTVTGTVSKGGTPIPNAIVQMTVDGVPSTVGVTNGTGAFTISVIPPAGALARFEVTAPVASGLPRLIAESTTFNLGAPVAITFDAALTTKNLANTVVQRGTPLPNAEISIVGTLATAGTIGGVTASGEVRFSAKANINGVLPAFVVPALQLTAVIFPNALGDHAVTAVDLRTVVPATINAAATVAKTTQLRESTNTTALPGAVLDAVPTGDLALAGAPTLRKTANASGNLTIDLAPGATYDVRVTDPNGNRAALRVVPNATSANLAATHALTKATKVQGEVQGSSLISGAVVQFLCLSCTGLERSRPIAEGVTGADGRFSLAVPDPD